LYRTEYLIDETTKTSADVIIDEMTKIKEEN
jgi:hypothetical protein